MDLSLSEMSDEKKALTAAVITVVVVSIAGTLYDLPFGIRSFVAVAAGFVVLLIVHYALTGRAVPESEQDLR